MLRARLRRGAPAPGHSRCLLDLAVLALRPLDRATEDESSTWVGRSVPVPPPPRLRHRGSPGHALRTDPTRRGLYVVVYDRQGYYTFGHYFARLRIPQARLAHGTGGASGDPREVEARVYYVVPALPAWEDLEERLALSRETLKQSPLAKDFGYFKIHRSPSPVRFWRWWS